MEANNKPTREADSIHRAMVIIAGIEMENPEDPPRLWTALEDAYDAMSDALGTDGDTTADEEEAKATGRHFVVRSSGDRAKLRAALSAALEQVNKVYDILSRPCVFIQEARQGCREARGVLIPALAAPPRNCDVGTPDEQEKRYEKFCNDHFTPSRVGGHCRKCTLEKERGRRCPFFWMQMPYEEGGAV